MKYLLKDASKTFSSVPCPVGKFNRTKKHSHANLLIKVEGVPYSEIRLNRDMLREVLLENPNEVRDLLGLVVKPYVEKQGKKVKTEDVGFTAEPTPTPIVQETAPAIQTETPVVEAAKPTEE